MVHLYLVGVNIVTEATSILTNSNCFGPKIYYYENKKFFWQMLHQDL